MIVMKKQLKKILEEVKPAKLVAATKYVDVKEIEKLEKLGVTCFGENRVQAFLESMKIIMEMVSFNLLEHFNQIK